MSANTTPAASHATAAAQASTSSHGASPLPTLRTSVIVSERVRRFSQRARKDAPLARLDVRPQSQRTQASSRLWYLSPVVDALLWRRRENLSEELRGHYSHGMCKEQHSAQPAAGWQAQLGNQRLPESPAAMQSACSVCVSRNLIALDCWQIFPPWKMTL